MCRVRCLYDLGVVFMCRVRCLYDLGVVFMCRVRCLYDFEEVPFAKDSNILKQLYQNLFVQI